jgi:hypothetical protein
MGRDGVILTFTGSYILIQTRSGRLGFAVLALTVGVSVLATNEASAKGCNGVVSPTEWGCAAWDNNNGPKFPHYKKPASSSKPAAAAQPAVAPPKQVVSPNGGAGLVSGGAGNIISGGAGNLVSGGAGNMRK